MKQIVNIGIDCDIPMSLYHVAMDWDLHSLVTSRYLPGHFPCQGYSPVGRGKIWADHEVQPPWSAADWLLSLRALHGDLQSHSVQSGGPTADHHLGHQDWHEEARISLRDPVHLAHTQVSTTTSLISAGFLFLLLNCRRRHIISVLKLFYFLNFFTSPTLKW